MSLKYFSKVWFGLVLCQFAMAAPVPAAPSTPAPSSGIVRIPVLFLQSDLNGLVTLSSQQQGKTVQLDSPIKWVEEPTRLPNPEPGYEADFRDFLGCARLSNLSDSAVCFNVMPDVSSVAVKPAQMQLQGFDELILNQLSTQFCTDESCQCEIEKIELTGATRNENSVSMGFSVTLKTSAHCPSDLTLSIKLTQNQNQ